MRRALLGVGVAVSLLADAQAAHAAAPTAKACIAAHEEAQALRTQKKPHAARDKFVACARAECPVVLRRECVDQLEAIERDAPTVVLEARDDQGNDTAGVKVSLDGVVVAERLTGGAVNVEPGEHVFRFERDDGKTMDQRVVVALGEKNRRIAADFSTLVPKREAPPPAKPEESRHVPALAWVAGGVALAAAGSFAFFAIEGKGKESDLAGSCAPRCSQDDVSPVKRDYLVADVSLGISVVSAAIAVVLVLGSSGSVQSARMAPVPWMPRIREAKR